MNRPSLRFKLQEAWPGTSGGRELVHLVDWPARQVQGRALCGRQTPEVALYPTGTAREVRADVCGACEAVRVERKE